MDLKHDHKAATDKERSKEKQERIAGSSEVRFRALVEGSSDWIWAVDEDAIYIYSSPKVRDLLGYEPEEIIGKTPFEFMTPDEAKRTAEIFSEIVRERKEFTNFENINLHKDGRLITLETSGVPVFDEGGVFCGYRGVDRDITKRKHTEAALQANEERYRWLVESSHAIPWEADASTHRFTYVGPQAEAILGYSQEEWYAAGFWMEHMHSEDRSRASRAYTNTGDVMEDSEFEYRIYAKDGRLVWIRNSINIISDAANPSIIRGLMFDITAQKQKEEALSISQQRLVESQRIAHLGHWDWDIITGSLHWSDEHFRICGLEPGKIAPKYEMFLDVIHPDDQEKWKNAVSEAMSKNNYNMDHRVVLPDGEVRYVHGQGQMQYDESGNPLRMMGTIQDITERKHLENALNTIAGLSTLGDLGDYYRACVASLANVYGTQYAFIGRFSDNSMQSITTEAVWANGRFVDNFKYELSGTPCDEVLHTRANLIPRNAQKLFPQDTMLQDMGVESYFGASLISASGHKLGLIAVLDTKEMYVSSWVEPILGIFAQRMASYIESKDAEEKIKSSEKEFRDIFRDMQDSYYRANHEGIIVRLSESVESLLGYRVDELLGTQIRDLYVDPDERRDLIESLEKGDGFVRNFELSLKHKDGSVIWTSSNVHYVRDANHNIIGVEGMVRDISRDREAELQMKKMSSALEQSADMVMITDDQGIVEYVNPAYEKITGYSSKEVVGGLPNIVKSDKQSLDFYRELWNVILTGEVFRAVFVNKKKNGELYHEEKSITPVKNARGEIINFVSTGHDITRRMENEERLNFLAHHDALTQLPNRILFMDRLHQSLVHAKRYGKKSAVLFVDLDRFKNINDTLGHDVGDEMLVQLSERLGGSIREDDTVARLGGDEFAILLNDVETEKDVSPLAQKILFVLEQPYEIGKMELFITASIGISLFPDDGEEPGTLLKNADIAMYRAKELGRNNFQFYAVDMSARAVQRMTMENSLRRALKRDEFELFYQPQVNAETDEITGVEALIRWRHPELGLVSPDDFIPLLEETGLISPVGYWVFLTACRQLQVWHAAGFTDLMMSVNISARQFRAKDFIEKIESLIRDSGVKPRLIEIEITESALMENQKNTIAALGALGEIGFRIAIDDFGTGYSSLNYLRRFRIDTLKVDRSFVCDVIENPDDAAIASAIIAMARSLKLKTIAEGVETQEQLDFLRENGCQFVQGYLFSRPLPVGEFTQFLADYASHD